VGALAGEVLDLALSSKVLLAFGGSMLSLAAFQTYHELRHPRPPNKATTLQVDETSPLRADLDAALRAHKASGEAIAARLRATSTALQARSLEPEVDAWEREVREDLTARNVGEEFGTDDLATHLGSAGLAIDRDYILQFLEAKIHRLRAIIGPDESAPEQAQQVSIWPSAPVVDDPERAPRNRRYTQVTVKNGSALPIIDVFVSAVVEEAGTNTVCGIENLEVLPAGEERTFDVPPEYQTSPGRSADVLRVVFIDAAGNRWERNGRGKLWGRL
jgi:hypothetical protein